VSRGVRDDFYRLAQPSSGWTVFVWTAMHRPNWSDEERTAKIREYGSRDHPDYRRNVLGEHGDAMSALFVLHRLMTCLHQDTKIQSNRGYLPIKNIVIGDVIASAEGDAEVINVIPSEHEEIMEMVIDGEVLHCTPDHRFLTSDGWVEAKDLRQDHEIVNRNSYKGLEHVIDFPRK